MHPHTYIFTHTHIHTHSHTFTLSHTHTICNYVMWVYLVYFHSVSACVCVLGWSLMDGLLLYTVATQRMSPFTQSRGRQFQS